MSFITPHSNASTEQAPPPSTSTTSLAQLSAITSTSTSTSSSTTQTQSQKKRPPLCPILNLLLVLVVIILLIVSIVQTWSHIHTLFSDKDSSSSSTTSPPTATNSSNSISSSGSSSRTMAAAPQFGGVDLGLTSSHNNEENVGETRDSHAVITSRPLVVRAVDIRPPPPTAPAHDPSTVTQPKTKPPPPSSQSHIPPGPHPEQQQPHAPSPEGTGTKTASKKKLDGIVAHTASTHDNPNHHPHDETSNPDSDQNNEASPTTSRNTVILTICAALGGLAGCFCCILGSSRLAICCCHRRRGIVASNGGVVCVDGKKIGPPQRPISRSSFGSSFSSSAPLVSSLSPSFGQQPQQQVQMTEFWNVDDPKDSKKSPTSSTFSPLSSKGFFKTLRRPSYNNTTSTSIPVKMKKDAPSQLPLAVTAPTAHVISSPVDFIPPQHSLDSPSTSSTTSPRGGGGLDSHYPPYTRGWKNLDFDPLLSPNPSSTTGSGSGTGTKSRRMPAHSPLPLPLSMPMSLKRDSCQYASSSLSSGLISPCTTMTPSTAGSSCSSNEMSPFPWSKSAPYPQNTDDKSYCGNTGRTMVMSKAQKPQSIDTDTASTLTTPATTAMMHTSPRTTRAPLLAPAGHSQSTTPTVPTPPSTVHFSRHNRSGANANSGAESGSNFKGPRRSDHPHHNYHHHIQQQPQRQQQQHSNQHSPHLPQTNYSHNSHNSPKVHYQQHSFHYNNNNNIVYHQGDYFSL